MSRILLIDDHTLFRESLVPVLDELGRGTIVHEASSVTEALTVSQHYQNLDLILMDLNYPDGHGWEVLEAIKKTTISTPIVILTASEDVEDIRHAMTSGCSGYLSKSCSRQELLTGIKSVLSGDIYISHNLLGMVNPDSDDLDQGNRASPDSCAEAISGRKKQVLKLMGEGRSNKQIAAELHISEGTVKLHVSSILKALSSTNRTEAVISAKRLGYL